MRSHRRWPLLGVVVTLIVGAGCTHDLGPSEEPAEFESVMTTEEGLTSLELLQSGDQSQSKPIICRIGGSSRYAVAYCR